MEKQPLYKTDKKLNASQRMVVGLSLTGLLMGGGCQLGNDLGRINNSEPNNNTNNILSKTAGQGLALGTTSAVVLNTALLAGGYKERRRREKESLAQNEIAIG